MHKRTTKCLVGLNKRSMSDATEAAPALPEVAVVSIDSSQHLVLKPILADLLQSGICTPGSLFLVEEVNPSVEVGSRHRAVRLLLGDGELCIQSLLSPKLHGLVDNETLYTGCVVRLNKFQVSSVDLAESEGEDASHNASTEAEHRASVPPTTVPPRMFYLVVEDAITVGWSNTFLGILGKPPRHRQPLGSGGKELRRRMRVTWADQLSLDASRPVTPPHPGRGPLVAKSSNSAQAITGIGNVARREEHDGDADADGVETETDDAFETMTVSEAKVTQRRTELEAYTKLQVEKSQLLWTWDDRAKPLKLTPLRLIPNLPYKQNWMVNVLVVVSSLSDVEPSHLPPYRQRTARLADPSTTKQVLLTVFLDPDEFTPQVGSVVLLVGAKNHMFDGGCLKKYASDRPKPGASWWFENPEELDWCDVEGLKAWWDGL